MRGVRLACVKPAASVRSEPGSNSQVENSILTKSRHSESTRTHTHHHPHHCDNNEVYSLVQNVTVKVYSKGSKSLQTPQASPPTFLFLLIFNCQKTDRISQSKNQSPQSLNPRKPTSIQLINLIYLERKTSSPAAPPPSFSERTYKRTTPNKSTAQITKNKKIKQDIDFKM